MGLGPLDAILGAVIVLLILLIRRRLAWAKSIARDIGVLGTTLAVIAITIFIGGALFSLRLMPGPAFTWGAVATSVVILAARTERTVCGLSPRLPFPHGLDCVSFCSRLSFLESLPPRRGWRLLSMPRGSPM